MKTKNSPNEKKTSYSDDDEKTKDSKDDNKPKQSRAERFLYELTVGECREDKKECIKCWSELANKLTIN